MNMIKYSLFCINIVVVIIAYRSENVFIFFIAYTILFVHDSEFYIYYIFYYFGGKKFKKNYHSIRAHTIFLLLQSYFNVHDSFKSHSTNKKTN